MDSLCMKQENISLYMLELSTRDKLNYSLASGRTQIRLSYDVYLVTSALLLVNILIPVPSPQGIRGIHNLYLFEIKDYQL